VKKSAAKLFQERLRQLRKARDWTQEQTAEQCGIGYKLYQLYELGIKQNPGLRSLEKIAAGFGLETHELLTPTFPQKRRKPRKNVEDSSRSYAK
jgi:transcriptional regulator with XRE-family HTH domain